MSEEQTTAIEEYSQTEAALAELREQFGGKTYEITTNEGMAQAKDARKTIKSYRTSLEKVRKDIKAPALERCRMIDSEAKRITAVLRELEDPIDEQIKTEERRIEEEREAAIRAEEERIDGIKQRIADIRIQLSEVQLLTVRSSDKIEAAIKRVENVEIDDTFAEFRDEASDAKAASIAALKELLEVAVKHEEEQAKIEAERAELKRLQEEEEERQAAARAEEERKQKIKEEADRKAREAEDARLAEERKAQEEREAAIKAEEERIQKEREELERQQREEEARKAAEKAEEERREKEAREAAEKAKFPGYSAIEKALSTYFGVPTEVAQKWISQIKDD